MHQRLLTMGFLATLLAAAACGGAAPASPGPQVAPPPAPLTGEVIETADKLVRVVKPRSEGWSCKQDHVETPVRGSVVTCAKQIGDDKLTLVAKDYAVLAPGKSESAEELATKVYIPQWKKLLKDADVKRSGPVQHAGHPSYELEVEGEIKGGRDRIVERVTVAGDHAIGLQAAGRATAFAPLREEISDWFAHAEFASLGAKK